MSSSELPVILLDTVRDKLWRRGAPMSFVITDAYVGACNSQCTSVCPVDAIHGATSADAVTARGGEPAQPAHDAKRASLQVYIDLEACICCAACEDQCAVGAVFDEDALLSDKRWCRDENAVFLWMIRRCGKLAGCGVVHRERELSRIEAHACVRRVVRARTASRQAERRQR